MYRYTLDFISLAEWVGRANKSIRQRAHILQLISFYSNLNNFSIKHNIKRTTYPSNKWRKALLFPRYTLSNVVLLLLNSLIRWQLSGMLYIFHILIIKVKKVPQLSRSIHSNVKKHQPLIVVFSLFANCIILIMICYVI